MAIRILTYALHGQADVVGARQRARQIAAQLEFNNREQTQIATSVSEIARNAFRYAGGGKVEFEIEGETSPQLLVVRVCDDGPGIGNLDEVLEGNYESPTGMGIGLIGSRRLMDRWDIQTIPGRGTTVMLGKLLPAGARVVTRADVGRLVSRLDALPTPTSLAEVQSHNAELLAALAELQDKQDKLLEMARELEDTNRGVVALYAELDEKAMHLRRADEMKTRFLSNMSHEFRTPLNSVRALCGLLLAKMDGPLEPEQEHQVKLISKASEDLSELVNDLLDLAKIEAGKVEVRAGQFEVSELFSALRGMLRPLLVTDTVELEFDHPVGVPAMFSDENKVSQILRNFISNALKFTERGTVRVQAALSPDGADVVFSVTDSGIGIAPEDQAPIFEEFTQLPSALQRKVKGTGLGLPLCRRLAALLGGEVGVESVPGSGSTFFARLPVTYRDAQLPELAAAQAAAAVPADRDWILVVEDDEATRAIYEKYLAGTRFVTVSVATIAAAKMLLRAHRPAALLLDIALPGEEGATWRWITELKGADELLPVIVASETDDERKALALGVDLYFHKPLRRDTLLEALDRVTLRRDGGLALIIDDDEAARYVIRRSLQRSMRLEEAADGDAGIAAARRLKPDVIFLDLSMPGMQGDEVLLRLARDPATAAIPVVVVTSREIDRDLRRRLEAHARAVLQKRDLSMQTLTRTLAAIGREVPVP